MKNFSGKLLKTYLPFSLVYIMSKVFFGKFTRCRRRDFLKNTPMRCLAVYGYGKLLHMKQNLMHILILLTQ